MPQTTVLPTWPPIASDTPQGPETFISSAPLPMQQLDQCDFGSKGEAPLSLLPQETSPVAVLSELTDMVHLGTKMCTCVSSTEQYGLLDTLSCI